MTLANKPARTKKNANENLIFSKIENPFQQPSQEQRTISPESAPLVSEEVRVAPKRELRPGELGIAIIVPKPRTRAPPGKKTKQK